MTYDIASYKNSSVKEAARNLIPGGYFTFFSN